MKALITGASSGIGRDMARVLAQKGYDLILVARRGDRLEKLKSELTGVNVRCITADLSSVDECLLLYENTKQENIEFLVNNAGFGLAGEFSSTDLKTELDMIDVNVKAVHILTKLYLKDFVKRDSGHILNVSSSASFMPGPLMATYYATKNYVSRLSEAVYQELKHNKSKVKISVLCPGPVDTEFNEVAKVRFAIKGLSSYDVARLAIDKALKGKLIIIPGALMKCAIFFSRLTPTKLLLPIVYKIQERKNR